MLQQAHQLLHIKQIQEALKIFEAIFAQGEFITDALSGMGLCYEQQGQLALAEQTYLRVLEKDPGHLETLNNLAICLQAQNKHSQALLYFKRLNELSPNKEIQYNYALALLKAQEIWEAFRVLENILNTSPETEIVIHLVFKVISSWIKQGQTALFHQLQDKWTQNPQNSLYSLALAAWYQHTNQFELMMRYYKTALLNQPQATGIYLRYIRILQQKNKHSEAFEIAQRFFNENTSIQSQFEMLSTLQDPVPDHPTQIEFMRKTLNKLLSQWNKDTKSQSSQKKERLPTSTPFYHSYQSESDILLQTKFAEFVQGTLPAIPDLTDTLESSNKPRLGIFSMYLRQHSVMNFLEYTVSLLLKSTHFETYLFHRTDLEHHRDQSFLTKFKSLANHTCALPVEALKAAHYLNSLQLDIIVYLDIGMDIYSYVLAAHRLAKHQLVLPGHPVTTGLKTIDYFVSSDLLEGQNPQERYSEKVLQLPGLPCYLRPPIVEAVAADKLNLPQGNLYFCPMTLFKLSPDFDQALIRILEMDSQACILILAYKNNLHERLYQRLVNTHPICKGRIYFLNWSDQTIFFQRLQAADVILDSFPFGGGNTSYQALNLGCPVVTLSQKAMKGRWTEALYQQMNMPNLVAYTVEDYATLAVQVATHKDWQAALRQQIKERNHLIFDDPTWSNALHDFCVQLTKDSVETFLE